MENEKEKATSPETGAEFNDILATDLYGRTLRIGLVMSYLGALWMDRKLPAPDYFGSTSEPVPLPGKKEIESGAKDAAIAHTLLAIFPNIYNEDQTLNKEAASKALENYLDAKAVVNAIPNKYPDQLTTVAGDVPNPDKAVWYYFALRQEPTPDLWEVTYKPKEDEELQKRTLQELAILKDTYTKLIDFYAEKTENGELPRTPDMFLDFIRQEVQEAPRHTDSLSYRTKIRAGAVSVVPPLQASPTLTTFQSTLSMYRDRTSKAYLLALKDGAMDVLKFQEGRLFFSNGATSPVGEAELQNLVTKQEVDRIDLPLLRTFYSILYKEFEDSKYRTIPQIITVYIPELSQALGKDKRPTRAKVDSLIADVQKFHNIIGVVHDPNNPGRTPSRYPVLNFEGYNAKQNTISFSSPYMAHVLVTIAETATVKTDKGTKALNKNGTPKRLPSHSFLIKNTIAKERNKAAVENVQIIVTLIEQAGNRPAHISAKTLVEKNPILQSKLDKSANPSQELQRTFIKTFELLSSQTRLTEVYTDIRLPDPKDPTNIPGVTDLRAGKPVYTFRHKGKKTKQNQNSPDK